MVEHLLQGLYYMVRTPVHGNRNNSQCQRNDT